MNEAKRQVVTPGVVGASGAVIMPAIPSFRHQPKTIDNLVKEYVCRVLTQIGLAPEQMYRWSGSHSAARKAEA